MTVDIHPSLLFAIEEILAASFDALKDPDWVAAVIRNAGVFGSDQRDTGAEVPYPMSPKGLVQSPRELAQFLIFMSGYPIQTALEIGSFNGWTAAIITAYLHSWNPCLQVTSIDPTPPGPDNERGALSRLLPVTFARITSADVRGQRFDLCFIDAIHDYRSVRTDYGNAGQFAKVCAFHDILFRGCKPGQGEYGGVPRFWSELRQALDGRALFREFIHQSSGQPLMGIGVRAFAHGIS